MNDATRLPPAALSRSSGALLVGAIFLLAICSLVYELIAGALSSYLLGDSVTQFSLIIGVFLTAMGAGSFLSRFFTRDLLRSLILIEILIGLIGGMTALAGFATFAFTNSYQPVLLGLVGVVGTLVGLEIPLVIRILRELHELRITLANVLSADYLGALAASLLFPFLLLPHLGLVHAGLLTGLLNVLVAGLLLTWFRAAIVRGRLLLWALTGCSAAAMLASAAFARPLVHLFESRLYQDEIIYSRDSAYQRIVITRWRDDVRLFLDGHLQFSSIDEHRYHECLVHPAMALARSHARILILGGGDGLAAREALKYPGVEHIDLVDIDPLITELFANRPMLTALNGGSLRDPRVHVHNVDAMKFLEQSAERYDVVLIDLPDPNRPALAKLYSRPFYSIACRRLSADGVLATQATSPFAAREAFWCIVHTIEAAACGPNESDRLHTAPYHTHVPSFGTWGFVLAAPRRIEPSQARVVVPARYLSDVVLPTLFVFPPDLAEVETAVTTLDDPVVTRLYTEGYNRYFE